MVTTIIIIAVIIVAAVLLISVLTTSKAYQYKHTVDPLEDNPHTPKQEQSQKDDHSL